MAGDLSFTEAVGTSAINGKLAGGNIAIVNGLVNTLPYYIVGSPAIKSPEDLKGRTAAVHIPGTAADFALRLALKRVGIPYNQIKAITVGGGPARIMALINGQWNSPWPATRKSSRARDRAKKPSWIWRS